MNNTHKLFLICCVIQSIIASGVSQLQSMKIKKSAKETKLIQLGVALVIGLIGIGQTKLIIKKIKSNTRGNY